MNEPQAGKKAEAGAHPHGIAALRDRLPEGFSERIDVIVRILFMVIVAGGCYLVLEPFLTAILIAAVLAVVTWPAFSALRGALRRSATAAAVLMVGSIVVLVLIPLSFLLVALAQQVPKWVQAAAAVLKDPMPLLEAIRRIPYAGPWLYGELIELIDPATFGHTVQRILEPLSSWILNAAVNVGSGLVQLAFVTFIVFFFYRDGAWFADRVSKLVERISGGIAEEIVRILVNTTRSVVFGIVGTAIGQGIVASIGFLIAGVPGVLILSFAVCLLSVIPIGPPLIWMPAAFWLWSKGEPGMAVFLALWGALAVSSVDNFIKPLLIARGTSMPIALIFLGVFGGVMAFGFLGLILGPLLLAVGIALFSAWLKRPVIELASATAKASRTKQKSPQPGANAAAVKRLKRRARRAGSPDAEAPDTPDTADAADVTDAADDRPPAA